MPEVVYPPRSSQRVLASEAPGGVPATVSLVVPTVTVPGEPFTVKVAVLDERGFPSVEFDGVVMIQGPSPSPPVVEVAFEKEQSAVALVQGVVIPAEGLYRFQAELGGEVFFSNPTCCTPTAES